MSCDASCEHADAGDVSEGGRAFDGFLPVLCEAAAASEPCECPLDHPAARQDDEALGRVGALDDLDGPAAVAAHGVLEFVACIAAVGEDVAQPWMAEPDRPEQVGSAVSILNIGPVDPHEDQEAERVGDDVALAPFDLLARVISANPAAFGGLDALAVDDAGRGLGLLAFDLARAAITRSWLIVARRPLSRQA